MSSPYDMSGPRRFPSGGYDVRTHYLLSIHSHSAHISLDSSGPSGTTTASTTSISFPTS